MLEKIRELTLTKRLLAAQKITSNRKQVAEQTLVELLLIYEKI